MKRQLLTEKFIPPTEIDEEGFYIWIGRYGEIIKQWHPDGKRKISWSTEMTYDLEAFYAIDAEAELTALLSAEIAAEIDRQIIESIKIKTEPKKEHDIPSIHISLETRTVNRENQ